MKHALFVILTLTILISCKLNQEKKEQQEPNGQRPSSAQLIDELDSFWKKLHVWKARIELV